MSTRALKHLIAPFEKPRADPRTTEIVVNRLGEMGVEAGGKWTFHETPDMTFDNLDSIGILAGNDTNQNFDESNPICGTALPGGERLQICRPPATSPNVISLTIRRPSPFVPTVTKLADGGLFTQREIEHKYTVAMPGLNDDLAQELTRAVLDRKNIMIAGATGSGKTTLSKALINVIPREERLITIEDTPEWNDLPHQNRVALFYVKNNQTIGALRAEDLLEASLRMRPDRVLMQELRDGATFAYLRSVVAGHPGCITTLHARSAVGAFDSLRLMIRQNPAGASMPDEDVRDLLKMHVDLVVHCERRGNIFSVSDVYRKA